MNHPNADAKVNVAIVQTAETSHARLHKLLSADPAIQIVGSASTEEQALALIRKKSPNVIALDIDDPNLDGFETTRHIMERQPVPIVICSAKNDPRDSTMNFRLMEVGAVAIARVPASSNDPGYDQAREEFCKTIKLMSEVRVVRRWPRQASRSAPIARSARTGGLARVQCIAIGASTGGPPVLQTILSGLPKEFPVPILIVQHIAPGFVSSLADWLNQTTGFTVQIAASGITPVPGHVYLAPDDFHMGLRSNGDILLTRGPLENHLRPSISHLFHAMAQIYGSAAIGVLLTGMGTDGAEALKVMKDHGATTIVQDRETSVVHGMPGHAISINAAMQVLPSHKIAAALIARTTIDRIPGDMP